MSKFSLINVMKEEDGLVSGYWLQDHVGTLETAKVAASETAKANSNKIDVAVVEQLYNTAPMLDYFTNLIRL